MAKQHRETSNSEDPTYASGERQSPSEVGYGNAARSEETSRNASSSGEDRGWLEATMQALGLTSEEEVAAGESASSTGADPQGWERYDDDGNLIWTTEHADVGVQDGFNAPELSQGVLNERAMSLRLLHGPSNPLETASPPSESDLFEELETDGTCVDDPTVQYVDYAGDVATPTESGVRDESTIYIGGSPSVEDIKQGDIGDCWFLASLINVTATDSGHIQEMVTSSGGSVTVNLFRYDGDADNWVPVSFTTDMTLARWKDPDSGDLYDLLGSGVRVGDAPVTSHWYADVVDDALMINAEHTFEMAMWAPLLSKGLALYMESYGQYGGYAQDDNPVRSGSGYEDMDGGVAHWSYPMMYGPDVIDSDGAETFEQTDVTYSPGSDLITNNMDAIANLLRVEGVGLEEGETYMMTTGIDPAESVKRLAAQTRYVVAQRDIDRYPSFKAALQSLIGRVETWESASGEAKEVAQHRVAVYAGRLSNPGSWPILHDEAYGKDYRDLNELLNVVMNLGDDESEGQRFIYAWHSYAVEAANFANQEGAALALTQENLKAQKANIDPFSSSVSLRNPHGENSPNEDGTGMEGKDDGAFTISLDQYLRCFGYQQGAVVRNT